MSSGPFSQSDDQEQPFSPGTDNNPDATVAPSSKPTSSATSGLPDLEGYHLLAELGRGGMGVVYKARHKKLDRTVALKMILGGQFASEEEVRRFELEAESAARLDHPGIVPIYEIGQSNGNHFFSMKLIEGQSLADRLDDYQPDPRKSVELMIEIARAVHHAHERGVLHRDLKPANILVDENGRALITDLGLAKQLDDQSGLTRTGLVMGSPGFMSPEQAAGKTDLTTGVDVYALGAILYWLIAGRPPFKGETQLEVILQTIDKEPESVRVHRPEADRDLNLICQKALQKSASNRYVSAAAFADDLQAWLDGEPLSVKPPSTLNLARFWIRKNFRTVALSLGCGVLCGFMIGMIILMVMIDNQLAFTKQTYAQLGDLTQPWVVKYFSWIQAIPRWLLGFLPICMVWLTVAIGIWTIGLIKPKSREVGMVAAITASLLAGIVAYTMSLGWSPITEYAINEGRQDIELISDSLWMEGPAERELAQRALMQRYPGLDMMNERTRGRLVFQKIILDQALGIPKGMWSGIGTTLCLAVLPLFFSCTFAGLIWQRGSRGWEFVGKSIELGIYSALFFLLLTKSVTGAIGTSPGFWYQFLTLGALSLALYWGVKDFKAAWRIGGFLLVNLFVFANFIESGKIDNAGKFAMFAESDEELQTAAHYFEKRLAQDEDQYDRFQLGIIYAYLDDDEHYMEQCRRLLSNFENTYRPNVAERIAKVCLLKPHLVSDLDTVHEFADIVSGYDSSPDREWMFFCKAMSEMRKGNLAETLKWNIRCRDVVDTEKKQHRTYLMASTHVVDALAYKQKNEDANAKASIELGIGVIDSAPNINPGTWVNGLAYQVLLKEAKQ